MSPVRAGSLSWVLSLVFALMITGVAAPADAANAGKADANAGAGPAAIPSNFRRHAMQHWTWHGLAKRVAAEGANDLYVSSPTGVQYLHYGASGAPCSYPPYYNSVPSFMAYVRNGYLAAKAQSFNLFSFGLRTARYRNVGPIRTVAPLHYRQTSTFVGTDGRDSRSRVNSSSTSSRSAQVYAANGSRSDPHPSPGTRRLSGRCVRSSR